MTIFTDATPEKLVGAFPDMAVNVRMRLPRDGDVSKTEHVLAKMLDHEHLGDYIASAINRSGLDTRDEFRSTYLKTSTQVIIDADGHTWLREEKPLATLSQVCGEVIIDRTYAPEASYLDADGKHSSAPELFADGPLTNIVGERVTLDDVTSSIYPFVERNYAVHMYTNATEHGVFLANSAPTYDEIATPIMTLVDGAGRTWKRQTSSERSGLLRRKVTKLSQEWICDDPHTILPIMNVLLGVGYVLDPESGRMTDGNIGTMTIDDIAATR